MKNYLSKSTVKGKGKSRITGKKIEHIDIDSLTLNNDHNFFEASVNHFEKSISSSVSKKSLFKEIVEIKTTSKTVSCHEKFKKFQDAKCISSDAFKDNM